MRVLGPNCLGLMRPPIGLERDLRRAAALPGTLALVSQSGAVCTAMLDWATPSGVGFSSVVSLGGSSDVDFGEVIDYLAADRRPSTSCSTSRACATAAPRRQPAAPRRARSR
jgi:acetyltransferase